MGFFLARFVALLSLLFLLDMLSVVQRRVVEPFTAAIASVSGRLIEAFDSTVVTAGRVIRDADSGFAVSIEAGCNGVEASIVLIAAVIAFPGNWRQRAVALALGLLAIQVLNIGRIASLFYIGQSLPDVFEWAHLYVWPALIMLDVIFVFMLYLRYLERQRSPVA